MGCVALEVACAANAGAEDEGARLGDRGVRLGDGVVARHVVCVCVEVLLVLIVGSGNSSK